MDEREMVSADEARAMEHRSDGCDEAADVMHMERSALRYVRTVIALHAIIEGRATAPTDAELAAHDERGALWMIAHERGDIVVTVMSWPSSRDWHVGKGATRWWPLESDGRPCAWPVVAQRPAGCICDFRDRKHRFSCLRQQPTLAVTRDEDGTFRVAGTEVDRGE